MTPPSPLLKNCPKEVQNDPLPFDECSTEVPDWRPAGERYQQLTVYLEAGGMEFFDRGMLLRPGFGGVYRPTRIFGIGAQFNTTMVINNFFNDWDAKELNALAKLDLSLNIDHNAKHRATFSLLGGINHVLRNELPLTEGGLEQEVTGSRFLTGAEFAWDIRAFHFNDPVMEFITLSPFLAFYYTPETRLSLSADESRQVQVQDQVRVFLGIRLGLEMFNVGNQPAPPP